MLGGKPGKSIPSFEPWPDWESEGKPPTLAMKELVRADVHSTGFLGLGRGWRSPSGPKPLGPRWRSPFPAADVASAVPDSSPRSPTDRRVAPLPSNTISKLAAIQSRYDAHRASSTSTAAPGPTPSTIAREEETRRRQSASEVDPYAGAAFHELQRQLDSARAEGAKSVEAGMAAKRAEREAEDADEAVGAVTFARAAEIPKFYKGWEVALDALVDEADVQDLGAALSRTVQSALTLVQQARERELDLFTARAALRHAMILSHGNAEPLPTRAWHRRLAKWRAGEIVGNEEPGSEDEDEDEPVVGA